MGVHLTDFGTATPVPSKRPAAGAAPRTPLADLLPYPLCVVAWGLKVISEANKREHHMARYRRSQDQKAAIRAALEPYGLLLRAVGCEVADHGARVRVTFTRIGAGKLDRDNKAGAFKHVQDEVARMLGVDDGNDRIDWRYEQKLGSPSNPGVVVEVEAA